MNTPPPPPPPHGGNAGAKASGLPPGNYDIFIIPPHSSGSGFLYLPSLQPHRNSFLAGVACTLFAVAIWTIVAPIFRDWFATIMATGGVGVVMLLVGVGVAGWAWGKTQMKTGGPGGSGEGSTGSHHGSGNTPGGAGSQQAGGSAPGGPPPGPMPGAGGTGARAPPKPSWQRTNTGPSAGGAGAGNAKGGWEKARAETRRQEEERRRQEEERKRSEELRKRKEEEEMERVRQRERAARERLAQEEEIRLAREEELRQWQARAKQAEEEARRKEAEVRDVKEREAREKEREAREREAQQKEAQEKEAREKEAREKEAREKDAREREARERRIREYKERIQQKKKEQQPITVPPTSPTKQNQQHQQPSASTAPDEASTYSYRPYDKLKRPVNKAPSASSMCSESSYTPSHSTARTTPPPSNRGPYQTKDPDKIVIKAVYSFNNTFPKLPIAQLVSGQGSVTDGLILRITTEGLFIDDDVRGVPQREWDVKAWTLKLVEVWCPPCGASSGSGSASARNPARPSLFGGGKASTKAPTSEESDTFIENLLRVCESKCHSRPNATSQSGEQQGLHVLRASIRDQEGKRYVFILQAQEGWKVAIGLQRLRRGTQVRALGVSSMAANDVKTVLGGLGWG